MIAAVLALLGPTIAPIDRRSLVSRHNVELRETSGSRPIQVGNGAFAFNADITGLQTLTPFNTMSHWGWHSTGPPEDPENFEGQVWPTHGRDIRYPMADPKRPALSHWMAANPHRINLGRIGLILKKSDGSFVRLTDFQNTTQKLDLWGGVVTSRFVFEGQPVQIKTTCHPAWDALTVQIYSPLLKQERLSVFVAVPGSQPLEFADYVGDWRHPLKLTKEGNKLSYILGDVEHSIAISSPDKLSIEPSPASDEPLKITSARYGIGENWADVTDQIAGRVQGSALSMRVQNMGVDPAPGKPKSIRVTYIAGGMEQLAEARENSELSITSVTSNRYLITAPSSADSLQFSAEFNAGPARMPYLEPSASFKEAREHWAWFWKSGGAVDFSGSSDPRAAELERRVILSQYVMAINSAGFDPAQESGLVNNGWYGRFHMEMVWWHLAHQLLWGRPGQASSCLDIYRRLLDSAKKRAKDQGYEGARWPKCVGPEGREWPHPIHALLIWQQPHPIFFAEQEFKTNPSEETVDRWAEIVEESAKFMASYAFKDEKGRYVLGPPIYVVSENTDPRITTNPAFELSYWRYGLRTAQKWRIRRGLAPNAQWNEVLVNLAPLPAKDGVYEVYEGIPDMWTKFNFEHPAMTGAYGMLPGDGVDPAVMARTLRKIVDTWNFERTWGWDFPMLAMCAARLRQPELAVDFLMHPSSGFQFDELGFATGGPYPYMPSNGGLLYAVAMMARGGWDGAEPGTKGFPAGWNVRWEGLLPAQ